MKACDDCRVQVDGDHEFCPLCGSHLHSAEPFGYPLPHNHYPDLRDQTASTNFVLRVLLFITILGCTLSVLVNLMVDVSFLWCLIVLAAAAYLWLTIPPLLRRGVNYTRRILFQALFTSLLVVGLDIFLGYQGWSVDYVVPGLLAAGIVSIGMMVVFNRLQWVQYVLYQVIMGLFGFIPLLLYFLGIAHSLVMVLVAAGLGLASILVTMVFGDRSIKTEFRRRFHL